MMRRWWWAPGVFVLVLAARHDATLDRGDPAEPPLTDASKSAG